MPVYISLLRGINVSGQKKIKMAEIVQTFIKTRKGPPPGKDAFAALEGTLKQREKVYGSK